MSAPRPYTLVAELTHRCPLACAYCSNPLELARLHDELDASTWRRVLEEAAALGVLQVHLTGGEPLARSDLEELVAHARGLDLYVNLVTSGIPLTPGRLERLAHAGVDVVQVSVQDVDEPTADAVSGHPGALAAKRDVLRWVKELGLPLTLNVVLHRRNLDRVAAFVALAEEVSADRLELANTQYLGWALANRDELLPTREQLERAQTIAIEAKARLRGRCEVLFVKPDYFTQNPRACMDGWARRFVHVDPTGRVLPCHAATSITGMTFGSVRDGGGRSLVDLWESDPSIVRFRGEEWMKEPCRSCDRRLEDFGGCRCQAFALTGDAAATDPACSLSPVHELVASARRRAAAAAAEDGTRAPRFLLRGRR